MLSRRTALVSVVLVAIAVAGALPLRPSISTTAATGSDAKQTETPTALPCSPADCPTPTITTTSTQPCTDPAPGGGGLDFERVGTPNHFAARLGEVCPGEADVWTFSTLGVPIEEFIGIVVVEVAGSVTVSVLAPGGNELALEPGEELRTSHRDGSASYQITVIGEGTGLAAYRVQVCRGIIDPCLFKPRPGDANCETTVNAADAAAILQLAAGLPVPFFCREEADVNEDGVINAIDAALILQFAAGLIPSLPP
jgi:hypothetical protein